MNLCLKVFVSLFGFVFVVCFLVCLFALDNI